MCGCDFNDTPFLNNNIINLKLTFFVVVQREDETSQESFKGVR